MTQTSHSSHKIPKIRFREFQGEWEENKLWNNIDLLPGFAFDSSLFWKDWKKLLIPKNFSKNGYGMFSESTTKYTTEEVSKKFICSPWDLMILITDLTPTCELLGNPLYLKDNDGEVLLNQRILKVIPKDNNISNKFLLNLLQTSSYKKVIIETASGTTVRHSSPKIIAWINTYFPSLPEQQKIASFLSSLDTRIEQLREKKSLLEEYKKWVMQKIFAREIRLKDEDGKEYGEWEEKRFDNVFSSIWTKSYQVKSSDILQNWEFPIIDQWQNMIAWYSNDPSRLLKNTPVIVFWDHTTILKYIDFDFIVWADGTKVLKNLDGNLKYLFYFLDFNRPNQEWYKRHFSVLRELKVLFPTLPEQQKIALFLSEIDARIQSTTEQLEEAEKWKKGLLQGMFV